MPASAVSLRVTDAYRDRLLRVRSAVLRAILAQWATLSVDDLDASYERFLVTATALTAGAQRVGVALSDAYLTAYLRSELGHGAAPVEPRDPDRYADRARDGRPLAAELAAPLVTVRLRLAQGQGRDAALRSGAARAVRLVAAEVLAAPRAALADAMAADDRVDGWRRAAGAGACGACLGAATGAIRSTSEVPDVHDHCRCSAEPVVAGVRDRVARPTGRDLFMALPAAEQDRTLGSAAELVRAGSVDLEDLVARSPQRWAPDQITQAPIAALQASTSP